MSGSELVTILFTDLVGSTELASRIGDLAADEFRRLHFEDLRSALAETGGREVKTIGDAIMASYPSAADALSGAVAMQRSIERRNRSSETADTAMRIGISAGDASFEDGDWFGTPVVEAARLCGAADGGQILISDLVRLLAGSRIEAELTPLGSRELKGLPEPLAICEVAWTLDDAPGATEHLPLPGFVDVDPTFPFAGRAAARDRLVSAWKEAAEGNRRVVLVSGEPGVGKTRLVTELVRIAHDQGALLLWGRCAEELDVPYQPFAEALRHYVHSVPADGLRDELGPLGGEMTRLIPDLGHLVPGLPEPVRTEAETERHRLFEAVSDLVEAVSRTTPIVLVLDDVHWADKPSLLLLRHLLRRPSTVPLLILATYRDTDLDRGHPLADVLADLRREPGVERLDLQGLDAGEVTAFMEHAAGHDMEGAGLELAAAVHRETQGNPFFIGEMLLHLAESGLIVQRDGRWESDFSLEEVGIPEGIREVVGRRLSRLSDTANRALTIGSVIGPEFDADLVVALSEIGSDEVFDALDEAVGAQILREVAGRFGRYAFAHALVRSTLYEELSTNRRVRMHAQVADEIERRHADDLDNHLDALAYHFSEGALAGDVNKGIEYCRWAAAKSTDDLAFEASVVHLDRALGCLELLPAPDLAIRFELQLALGNALRAASDPRHDEAGIAAIDTARGMTDPDRLAEAAVAMTSGVSSRPGLRHEPLIAALEDALDALDETPTPMRARLLAGLAVELFWDPTEKQRQQRCAAEALEVARVSGDPETLAFALINSWALVEGTEPFLDLIAGLHAEAAALEWNDPTNTLVLHRARSATAAATGDRVSALHHLAASIDAAEQLRQPLHLFRVRTNEAMLHAFAGELAAAEEKILAAMGYGLDHGLSQDDVTTEVGGILYMIRRAQGRIDELVSTIEHLVETRPGAPVWRIALAGTLCESGRPDEAREQMEYLTADGCAMVPGDVQYPVTMCGIARLSHYVPLEPSALRHVYDHLLPFAGTYNWSGVTVTDANDHGLGVASACLGDHEASDRHFAAAIALAERAGARPYEATGHLDWARMLAARGETGPAAEHAQRALAIGEAIGMDGPFGVVRLAQELLDDTR